MRALRRRRDDAFLGEADSTPAGEPGQPWPGRARPRRRAHRRARRAGRARELEDGGRAAPGPPARRETPAPARAAVPAGLSRSTPPQGAAGHTAGHRASVAPTARPAQQATRQRGFRLHGPCKCCAAARGVPSLRWRQVRNVAACSTTCSTTCPTSCSTTGRTTCSTTCLSRSSAGPLVKGSDLLVKGCRAGLCTGRQLPWETPGGQHRPGSAGSRRSARVLAAPPPGPRPGARRSSPPHTRASRAHLGPARTTRPGR